MESSKRIFYTSSTRGRFARKGRVACKCFVAPKVVDGDAPLVGRLNTVGQKQHHQNSNNSKSNGGCVRHALAYSVVVSMFFWRLIARMCFLCRRCATPS